MDLFSFSLSHLFSLPSITNSLSYFNRLLAHSFCVRLQFFFIIWQSLFIGRTSLNDVQYWVLATLILAAFILCGDDAVITIADAAAVSVFVDVTVIVAMLASNNQVTKYINECI